MFLYLFSDAKIDQEILKLNTDSLHLYYWGERTINFTILDGSWNHICLTWNSEENGQWFLYINGVVQIEGIGFGSEGYFRFSYARAYKGPFVKLLIFVS